MPYYKVTEYRGVNLVGLSASGKSIMYADNLDHAKLSATCINSPKGEWKQIGNEHIIGSVSNGNMSIVEPMPADYDPRPTDHLEYHI